MLPVFDYVCALCNLSTSAEVSRDTCAYVEVGGDEAGWEGDSQLPTH